MANFIFPLLLVLMTSAKYVNCVIQEEELRHNIFHFYDKYTRPSNSTALKLRFSIKHFDMMEASHSLVADTWMVNEWNDRRLRWRPKEFGGIEKISVPYDMLWKPDLGIYNSANAGEEMTFGNTLAILFHTGRILFLPTVKLHFTCVMDLTYWPHDTHKCTCVIGSWVHDGHDIEPIVMDNKPKFELTVRYTQDGRNLSRSSWTVMDSSLERDIKNYTCCDAPYRPINKAMVVSRNAPAYEWTIKGPAIGLSILTMVLFILPPAAGEKMIFGVLCLLLDLIYIAFTSFTISMSPSHLPIIVEMVCKQSMLVIGSIVVGALSLRLARDPHTRGLPPFIKRPLVLMSSCLCLQSYKNLASRVHHHQYSDSLKSDEFQLKENGNGHMYTAEVSTCPGFDWLLLSAFIDRVCLIVFVIIFAINMYYFSAIL